MSKAVDAERAQDAADAESIRLEGFLLELLTVVRARRRDVTQAVVAEQLDRCERTVRQRERMLDELLRTMKRKGFRRTQ